MVANVAKTTGTHNQPPKGAKKPKVANSGPKGSQKHPEPKIARKRSKIGKRGQKMEENAKKKKRLKGGKNGPKVGTNGQRWVKEKK